MSSPARPTTTTTSGPFLLVGLVLASLLCVLCYVAPVLWIVEWLDDPGDDYAGLGLVIGGISVVLVSVPTLLVVIAWVLAARARATLAGWFLLVASALLVLAAPTAAGQLVFGGLVLLATVAALAAVACAITALVRGRRPAAQR
ncbi:hypothetical protein [uncultured Nocardioides sp.]|uniref:hypothetical protein n=1 Tax=uncultured Nocardioides sp. TaxID=198441 RepID=UPI002632E53B|nr:hypothetical protein [uncultured Nocardioides sp.]